MSFNDSDKKFNEANRDREKKLGLDGSLKNYCMGQIDKYIATRPGLHIELPSFVHLWVSSLLV